jgi:hypothetical protein
MSRPKRTPKISEDQRLKKGSLRSSASAARHPFVPSGFNFHVFDRISDLRPFA